MSRRPVRPLAARLYLFRNPRRVLPAIAVQALVTALVLAVVTPLSSFEATTEVELKSLEAFTAITPMRAKNFEGPLAALIEANPAMERHVRAKSLWIRTPMIVAYTFSPLLALARDEQEDFLRRVGDWLVEGDFPEVGHEGAVIHRDVARARGMRVGDRFGRLVDPEDPTPGVFQVVGLLDGPARLGVVDLAYASIPDRVLARQDFFEVVYAQRGRKAESDRYLNEAKDAEGKPAFRVTDEAYVRRESDKELKNLPLVVNAIVGSITVVIALVVVLLSVISFQARADEFGLLLAVGHRRRRLVGKLAKETAAISVVAWAIGLCLGYTFLAVYRAVALEPKAILIRFVDPYALALASTLPIAAAAASALVLALRLRRMDPVAVIQRRNA